MRYQLKNCVSAVLMLFSITLLTTAQPVDQVVKTNDKTIRGTIQSITLSEVKIKQNNGDVTTVNQQNVKQLNFGDTTQALGNARQALSENRFGQAIQSANKAKKEVDNGTLRKFHRPRITYILGRSHFLQGNFDNAIRLIEQQLNRNASNQQFYPLVRTLILSKVYKSTNVKSSKRQQKYSNLKDALSKWLNTAQRENAPETLNEKLNLLEAEAREEFGKIRQARSKYNRLTDSNNPSIKRLALSGYHRCAVRLGNNIQGAVNEYEQLLEKKTFAEDTLLKAGKHFALGYQLRTEWKNNKKDVSLLRKSLLHFLRASVLNPSKPDDPTLQQRQNLLHAAKTYQLLAKHGPDKGTSFFRSQAKNTLRELIEIYPKTPESIKAEQKLGNLQ